MSGGAVVTSRDRRDRNRLDRESVQPLMSERIVCEEIMICSDNLDTPTDGSTQGGRGTLIDTGSLLVGSFSPACRSRSLSEDKLVVFRTIQLAFVCR